MNEATAAVLGVVLGAATGVPLGVVNVSVVEAAARAGRRHAAAIGLGGALADGIHAGLAFVGVAPRLAAHPALVRGAAAASAAIVVGYAAWVWRGRGARAAAAGRARDDADAGAARVGVLRGVALGLGLTLPNPAPLAAWIAVAGALLPRASAAEGVAAAIGVGVGSAAWFAALAALAERSAGSPLLTRWLPRAVAVALVGLAAATVARAFW